MDDNLLSERLSTEYGHRGMFLLAAASAIAFWAIESIVHRRQMNYYVRTRDIEVVAADMQRQADPIRSTPQIDWSWSMASDILEGKHVRGRGAQNEFPAPPRVREISRAYRRPWMWPIVWLPHGITTVLGGVLFVLGHRPQVPTHSARRRRIVSRRAIRNRVRPSCDRAPL